MILLRKELNIIMKQDTIIPFFTIGNDEDVRLATNLKYKKK